MIYAKTSTDKQLQPMQLKSENLSESVAAWLKNEILKGTYQLGDELPSEQELCSLLGVGKSSIREALKMLQMIGVVEIRQGKRTKICDTIKPDIMMPMMFYLILQKTTPEELFNFRVMFETAVVKYLLSILDNASIHALTTEVARYRQLCEEGRATVDDEFVFHKTLLESCHNQYIMQIGVMLLDLFEGPISKAETHDCERVLQDHQMILDALVARDSEALDNAMHKNFSFYREILGLQQV